MSCWSEEAIDLAAMRLADMGFAGDLESLGGEIDRLPGELLPLLRHSLGCVRCGELLSVFLMAETRLRAGSVDQEAPGRSAEGGRVYCLQPLSAAREDPASPQGDDETPEAAYSLAADSDAAKAGDLDLAGDLPSLTLQSEDGRYLVRLFPGDRGAVGLLLRSQDLPTEEASREGKAAPLVRLRYANREIAFGPDGVAHLPEFPTLPVELLVDE